MSIAAELRIARKRKQLTQLDLAEKLGVTVQAVSQWENARTLPGPRNLMALAKILDIDLGGSISMNEVMTSGTSFFDPGLRAPLIPWEDVDSWAHNEPEFDLSDASTSPTKLLEVTWQPEGQIFALTLQDDSMVPVLAPQDVAIFDTGAKAKPGGIVLAKSLLNPIPLVRKLRLSGFDPEGKEMISLIPLNADYPTHSITSGLDGNVVGCLREIRRTFPT